MIPRPLCVKAVILVQDGLSLGAGLLITSCKKWLARSHALFFHCPHAVKGP